MTKRKLSKKGQRIRQCIAISAGLGIASMVSPIYENILKGENVFLNSMLAIGAMLFIAAILYFIGGDLPEAMTGN